jgi:hypothetical protein
VRGSDNPLAVIIVGVGNADFSDMDKLDGENDVLYSNTNDRFASANIVKFVHFEKFKNDP